MMTELLSIDSAISGRICLCLLHSLWQVALLWIIAATMTRLLRATAQRTYAVFTVALVASLIAVPITYRMLPVETPAASFSVLMVAPTATQDSGLSSSW